NPASGLPRKVCLDWQRRSFQDFPDALAQYRNPKNKSAADAGVIALIQYLNRETEANGARRVLPEGVTVGDWAGKFTDYETSPRTGRNASKNRPYSPGTLDTYKTYYNAHIKDDPFAGLLMSEVDEDDVTAFINRLSAKRLKNGNLMGGSRTFAGTIIFLRMVFGEFRRKHKHWYNPFQDLDPPGLNSVPRDALPEDEFLKLFSPGVLRDTMELAVCACMFLSGLRRAEIGALKPDCLDWNTSKITLKYSWQRYEKKNRVLGPPKSKKVRDAPFDPILQAAIKKLWEENGRHEFVFSFENGRYLHSSWIERRFPEWLKRAGIELGGRRIVPHSSRHSLASLLEERGISLRYIQDMLGHSDLKTTKRYLHSTEATIRTIGKKINESMQQEPDKNIVEFKTS
ncbi:MAG: tyrosine-type recombinase/integrase, partial [Treponema sp.]|nr:tyrosine-type recombinase/integrase [Treponema sp.]